MSRVASRLVLATNNAKKLAELRRILPADLGIEVLGLADLPAYPEPAETGATFADNALLKAREAVARTGLPAAADDSGLAVDALNGMPGVLSARWSGAGDAANNALVLDQLADTPDERRGAAFVCVIALVLPDGTERLVEGRMPGRLVREPRGTNGFGYDPIFQPHGESRTSAEMAPAEKDAISHRGQALRGLVPVLTELLR
jgi:XTP/dITP diphosphohydrolase